MTLRQIVAGIDERLATIPDLNHYDRPPNAATFPCAFPVPPPINYRETMRSGVITLHFEVVAMDSTAPGDEGQLNLYDLLDWDGPKSIFQALEADKHLGLGDKVNAVVSDVTRPLGLDEIGGYEAYGCAIPYVVVITNT